MIANTEQSKDWNEVAGPRWVRFQEILDAVVRNRDGAFVAPDDATFQAAAAGADWKGTPGMGSRSIAMYSTISGDCTFENHGSCEIAASCVM